MCEEEKQFDVKLFLARVSKLFFARMKMIYGPGIKIMFARASIFVDPYQNTFWPGYHFLLARIKIIFGAGIKIIFGAGITAIALVAKCLMKTICAIINVFNGCRAGEVTGAN